MKSSEGMPKIVKIRESLLSMQICASIPPEEKEMINEELKNCGLSISGTTYGWKLDESEEPVKCNDYEGRWHYICTC